MLPDAEIQRLARKVTEFFGHHDADLLSAARRLQDDGYDDTSILNILTAAYYAGMAWGRG